MEGKGQVYKAVVYSGIGTKRTLRSTGAGMNIFELQVNVFDSSHLPVQLWVVLRG